MKLTWAQKKESMQELIEAYYAPPLREGGFVSYKDEGFHWYRFKGELLQTVRMPIFSPSSPVFLDLGFGAVPLFTWEQIAPSGASRDFDWDYLTGRDHVSSVRKDFVFLQAQKILGSLPRRSYAHPELDHHLENGLLIGHLNTERCGGEAVDELILPLLDKMLKVEDIYQWNKQLKAEMFSCSTDEELIKELEKEYLGKERTIFCLSLAFADECIYCRDEGFYPILLHGLKQDLNARLNAISRSAPLGPKTKAEAEEWAADIAHEKVLIDVLETGDRKLFDEELERQKERMLQQIRKKLPKLDVGLR